MLKLEGKVAVITGGSTGIGLASAKRLVEEGAYVFITGRRAAELEAAKSEIGHHVTTVQGDVSNLEDLDRLYASVLSEKGHLEIVVANAAMVERATIETATPGHFDKIFNVNARGTFFTVQKALPLMKGGGSIILVAAASHQKSRPCHSTYSATKAAIRSFSRTWAAELKGRGIRVNTLSPGVVDTPIIDGLFPTKEAAADARAIFAQATPMGRLGRPEELAAAVFYLASDESSFVTGIDLPVDSGLVHL